MVVVLARDCSLRHNASASSLDNLLFANEKVASACLWRSILISGTISTGRLNCISPGPICVNKFFFKVGLVE